jgi:eukaryotic-like serine/threonine-protein kinase
MADRLEKGTSFAHYRIVSKIGAGGMGEVYLAEDTKLDRRVALKILPSKFADDKDRMSRFVREAKSASALNHPNIITIYEINEFEETHFIATEFVAGKTLNEFAKSTSLKLKSALDAAIQIASALDAAHTAGIIHRDIKPDNVMIRPDGLVKLLDFGIAKLAADNYANEVGAADATTIKIHTAPGIIIGTADYMSPEQARGKTVDARTDIFSFGVVLYELLAGKRPFQGENNLDTIGSILHREAASLTNFQIPDQLQKIVEKCLQKNRDDRYQILRDLLADLKEVQRDLESADSSESILPFPSKSPTQNLKAGAVTANQGRKTAEATTISGNNRKFVIGGAALILLVALVGFGIRYFKNRTSAALPIESIAVLPFVNESGNNDVEYLSDGMTESLINSLSQLPHLAVKARSSVFRYKGKDVTPQKIGSELNVQAILSGRVIERDSNLTLYLELVEASTGNRIWGERYDRKLTDLVSLQNEIAYDVSNKLKTKLSGAEQNTLAKNYTENTEAYRLYLQGRFYWNKRTAKDLLKAIEDFEEAVRIDPNYALAYAGLADSYALLSPYIAATPAESMPKAREYAVKALSLDDQLVEAHTALGLILNTYDYDFDGAEREFKRAIEINPNYATAHQFYGELLMYLDRREESDAEFRRALEIDPLSLIINRQYGESMIYARKYEASIVQLKKTLDLDASFVVAHVSLSFVYQLTGRYPETIEEFAKFQEMIGEKRNAAIIRESFAKGGFEGFLRTMTGEDRLSNTTSYSMATWYAKLGEKDKAFDELNKAYENREYYIVLLKVDPRFDDLRSDARFPALLRRVGFPQ